MNRKNGFNLLGVLALLVVLGAALAAAGCTSGSNGTATTPAPTAAGTAGVTAAGTAGPAGPAVGYDRLMPFLPKTAGRCCESRGGRKSLYSRASSLPGRADGISRAIRA